MVETCVSSYLDDVLLQDTILAVHGGPGCYITLVLANLARAVLWLTLTMELKLKSLLGWLHRTVDIIWLVSIFVLSFLFQTNDFSSFFSAVIDGKVRHVFFCLVPSLRFIRTIHRCIYKPNYGALLSCSFGMLSLLITCKGQPNRVFVQ